MTEQNLESHSQPVGNDVAATSASTQTTYTPTQPAEKVLRQSEVNEIIKGAKQDAYRKGREEVLAEMQKQQAQPNTLGQQQQGTSSMGGMPAQSSEEISRLVAETINRELPRHIEQQTNNNFIRQVTNDFANKVIGAAQNPRYPDYEKVVSELNLPELAKIYPEIIPLANSTENTSDVVYDLAKNPQKITHLVGLVRSGAHYLAQMEMNRLSASIKENLSAQNQKTPNEPLGQVKSSITGTGNGLSNVSDLRRNSAYKV